MIGVSTYSCVWWGLAGQPHPRSDGKSFPSHIASSTLSAGDGVRTMEVEKCSWVQAGPKMAVEKPVSANTLNA